MYSCTRWRCGKCSHVNRRKGLTSCANCKTPKDKGESLHVLPGDWSCNACGVNNFARNLNCFRCRAVKHQNPVPVIDLTNSNVPPAPTSTVRVLCPDSPPQERSRCPIRQNGNATMIDFTVKDSLISEFNCADEADVGCSSTAGLADTLMNTDSLSTTCDPIEVKELENELGNQEIGMKDSSTNTVHPDQQELGDQIPNDFDALGLFAVVFVNLYFLIFQLHMMYLPAKFEDNQREPICL